MDVCVCVLVCVFRFVCECPCSCVCVYVQVCMCVCVACECWFVQFCFQACVTVLGCLFHVLGLEGLDRKKSGYAESMDETKTEENNKGRLRCQC